MTSAKIIDDGGLAFPGKRYEQVGTMSEYSLDNFDPTYDYVHHSGMSLRDYFAAQALPAMMEEFGKRYSLSSLRNMNEIASDAYAMADAMIAARKEGQPT